jgi:hypothetical protein
MTTSRHPEPRGAFLALSLATPALLVRTPGAVAQLGPTPARDDDGDFTAFQPEGPRPSRGGTR